MASINLINIYIYTNACVYTYIRIFGYNEKIKKRQVNTRLFVADAYNHTIGRKSSLTCKLKGAGWHLY